ncbi:hypothetical protein CHS0354_042698, partial [Potamilus streckersoni]
KSLEIWCELITFSENHARVLTSLGQVKTWEKCPSPLKTHIPYYLDMDNKMLESNRFFPLIEEEAASEGNGKKTQIVEGNGLNDLNEIKPLTSSPNSPTSRKKKIKRKMRLASQSSCTSERVSEDKGVRKSNLKKEKEGEIRENKGSETDKDTELDVAICIQT